MSVVVTIMGAVMVGFVLAPLSTYYSLMLDALSPPHRKAEVFALSRTANSIGIILTSASLALTSLAVTQAVSTAAASSMERRRFAYTKNGCHMYARPT
jgi:hypothetical protein